MSDKRYTVGGKDGWLNIKREPIGMVVAVPEFIQVKLNYTRNNRDFFVILEGNERGKEFSVLSGNIKSGDPGYRGAANLQFSISKKLLTYPVGKITAITAIDNPIPVGVHPIQLPDFPHELGRTYMTHSSFAKNWFYLGHGNAIPGNNDRYLHPGSGTLGCITVEPSAWTKLYQYLILCRRGDGKTVGTVTVVR